MKKFMFAAIAAMVMRKVCGNIPQKVGECKVPNHVIIGKL